jgi:hypothetical protein
MTKKPQKESSEPLNPLNMSATDLASLAAIVQATMSNSQSQPVHAGERYISIRRSSLNLGGPLHLKVPYVLESLPDTDPRIISWVMSNIYEAAYKPGFYRANTTDVSLVNDKNTLLHFTSHFEVPQENLAITEANTFS